MNRQNNSVVLLITGCITPNNNVYKVSLKDSKERFLQYIDSIKYYLSYSKIRRIVYCDNSGAAPVNELFDLAEKNEKQFEWLSFVGNSELTVKFGKGYGESEIVNYAIEHSKLISITDFMVKVTGRLIVKNVDCLFTFSNRKLTLWPIKILDADLYINTRIYMMPVQLYKDYFWKVGTYVNDVGGVYLEHAFGYCIRDAKLQYNKFIIPPWIEGISGSTGIRYNPTCLTYLKDCIKLWMYKE